MDEPLGLVHAIPPALADLLQVFEVGKVLKAP